MIGVLAIIAILAVVIVPKVFSTIASSRITNAVGSVSSVKTAISEFAGKFGAIPLTDAESRIDDLLVKADMLESRFAVKIGTPMATTAGDVWTNTGGVWGRDTSGSSQAAQSRVICVNTAPAAAPGAGTNFRLDGNTSLPAGTRVISVVITGLTTNEARELSQRIDGDALTEPDTATADARGKVTYTLTGATRTAYVYLAHQ